MKLSANFDVGSSSYSLKYWYISSRLCGIIPEDAVFIDSTLRTWISLRWNSWISLICILVLIIPTHCHFLLYFLVHYLTLISEILLRSFCSFLILHSCTHIAKVSITDFNYFVCSTLRPVVQFMKCQWQWKRTQRIHDSLYLWVMASSSLRRGLTVRKLWRPFNILS